MRFKVAITCRRCDCTFELSPTNFKSRDACECPNCGQEIPAEIYADIKSGALSLGRVPYRFPKSNDLFDPVIETGFEFAVKESKPALFANLDD